MPVLKLESASHGEVHHDHSAKENYCHGDCDNAVVTVRRRGPPRRDPERNKDSESSSFQNFVVKSADSESRWPGQRNHDPQTQRELVRLKFERMPAMWRTCQSRSLRVVSGLRVPVSQVDSPFIAAPIQ